MDEFAIQTFEHHLGLLIAGLADPKPTLYSHAALGDDGIPEKVEAPRVIVAQADYMGDIGFPRGPATDIAFVDLTELVVYVETPFIVTNPAPPPDELDGQTAIHIPVCRAIRTWLLDNRLGLEVTEDIKTAGCDREVFGLWQPPRREIGSRRISDRYWRHVFFVILQKMEVA